MTNYIDNPPSAFLVLLTYKAKLIPQVTDLLAETVYRSDTMLSQRRAAGFAAAIIYDAYLAEYDLMVGDERTGESPEWFEDLWNFMMDSTQETIQHVLVRVTWTETLYEDALALHAGVLTTGSFLRPIQPETAKAWLETAIATAQENTQAER